MSSTKLENLVEDTGNALANAGASEYHLRIFRRVTKQLMIYANKHGITSFTLDFGIKFLEHHYSFHEKVEGKKFLTIYLHCINELDDYMKTGSVSVYLGKISRIYEIPECFQSGYESYIAHRTDTGMSTKTVIIDKLYLERFLFFISKQCVQTLNDITLDHVFVFLDELSKRYEKATVCSNMRTVRLFLKYCYENGLIQAELFSKIPNVNYCRQSRLPSVYTAEEVKSILSAIDLGNPCGKRNYAIVLLIARSGLRSSDIADLRFSDIDWEHQKIIRIQKKTGNPVELPLLNDVGEAIIDYLKNYRPSSDSDHVFIQHKPPYSHFGSSAVGAMVRRIMQKAGVKSSDRKCGSHALRHSLASRLLENDIPLPVISEILGHTNTKTTMDYLRIDVESLKSCALEVEV